MKTKTQQYFANEADRLNDEFVYVEGFAGEAGSQEQGFADNNIYADSQRPKSDPYILVIQNTNAFPIANLVVLNSASAYPIIIGTATPIPAGINIYMGIGSVTYREFLASLQVEPARIGLTILESNLTATDRSKNISLVHRDVRGYLNAFSLNFVKDPYQDQNATIKCDKGYSIDFFTAMIIRRIAALETLQLLMYPAVNYKSSRTVNDASALSYYANPEVVSPATKM